MVDWTSGYSATYYMTQVDPITWRDLDRIEITGGSISRELDGLQQTADIETVNYPSGTERWIRIHMDAKQGENSEHVVLFTGLATSPDRDIDGTRENSRLQCYSVLKYADDKMLERGWYAPAESDGAVLIRNLLRPFHLRPNVSGAAPLLRNAIVAEDGETVLTMIERILSAMSYEQSWQLKIDGRGEIYIEPSANEPVVTLDPLDNDIIETQIKVSADWYSCPNVFMAINNDVTGIAKDESEDSPLSIQNRGREVWMYESSCSLADNESIAEYAQRRLEEEQVYAINGSYERRFLPDVMPGNIIRLRYPRQGLNGDFIVRSQTIELGYAGRTSEEVTGGMA